ncbi:bacteriocin propeptide, TIGR03798 family/class IIb bacteriocin, lactobin A/cerein 7B family [Rivularia sp. PCC 7116]|uniref:Nif11-like leader peptide family natural product precursor n=1 Tax=Rivularia sp. PCC 7116 TaxID=373994 RepID=UPI00029EDEFB|nr:Nif11-like leader peptide family natural product precursor [Rivularia sp. PCC 7116]AFY58615.1 bacteriocin propeptide, TIGR03798 family/class IIb bacteriocin, lactobin A/cerein 7B family [Rivularia sp. PCC 7116]
MSTQTVNQFFEKVSEDPELQQKLVKAIESENDRQAVTDLAAQEGFQFTSDELWEEIKNRQQAIIDSGELSEEELEAVAGGATPAGALVVTIMGASGAIGGAVIKRYAKW